MEEESFEGEEAIELVSVPFEDVEYVWVCPDCGRPLTEILYYGRYYCKECGNHF